MREPQHCELICSLLGSRPIVHPQLMEAGITVPTVATIPITTEAPPAPTVAINIANEPQVTRAISDPNLTVTDNQVPSQIPIHSPQHTPEPQVQTPHPPQPQRTGRRVRPPTVREKMFNQIQEMQEGVKDHMRYYEMLQKRKWK